MYDNFEKYFEGDICVMSVEFIFVVICNQFFITDNKAFQNGLLIFLKRSHHLTLDPETCGIQLIRDLSICLGFHFTCLMGHIHYYLSHYLPTYFSFLSD